MNWIWREKKSPFGEIKNPGVGAMKIKKNIWKSRVMQLLACASSWGNLTDQVV